MIPSDHKRHDLAVALSDAFTVVGLDPQELVEELKDVLSERTRMAKKVKAVTLPTDQNAMLARWWEVSTLVATLKNEENQLRNAIVLSFPFDKAKLEGAETIDIGNGWRLKATKNQNYSATNESGQTEALLNAVGALNPAIASSLVKWKPELSTKVYRDLLQLNTEHPELSVLIAAATTVKPGMPELEIVPPKGTETMVADETGVTVTDGSNIKF